MSDLKRIRKEFTECKKDPKTSGLDVTMPDEANALHWKATIKGPVGTPYEGGVFKIDIQLPNDYPFVPPKMKYDTKIWHPNISSETGTICLDILKGEWSPALTVRTALLSLQALMSAPEPDDPQDAVVAGQYKKSYEEYKSTAKYWTETYASGGSEADALKKLMEMGFTEEQCRRALDSAGGDENRALDALLAGLAAQQGATAVAPSPSLPAGSGASTAPATTATRQPRPPAPAGAAAGTDVGPKRTGAPGAKGGCCVVQ